MTDVRFSSEEQQLMLTQMAADAILQRVAAEHRNFRVLESGVRLTSVPPCRPYIWARFAIVPLDPRTVARWFQRIGADVTLIGVDGEDMVVHFEIRR